MTNRTQEKYFSGIGQMEIGDWDLIGYCEEAFYETAIFVSWCQMIEVRYRRDLMNGNWTRWESSLDALGESIHKKKLSFLVWFIRFPQQFVNVFGKLKDFWHEEQNEDFVSLTSSLKLPFVNSFICLRFNVINSI